MDEFSVSLRFKIITCYKCSIHFGVPIQFYNERRSDHEGFHCPNGHCQYFTHESEEERLKRQLKDVQACCVRYQGKAERIERSRNSYKGHFNRLKNEAEESGDNGDGS